MINTRSYYRKESAAVPQSNIQLHTVCNYVLTCENYLTISLTIVKYNNL